MDLGELSALFLEGNEDVKVILQVQPELGGGAEEPAETDGSVGGDTDLAADDHIDAAGGDAGAVGQGDLGQAFGFQKFFEEHLARMDRGSGGGE